MKKLKAKGGPLDPFGDDPLGGDEAYAGDDLLGGDNPFGGEDSKAYLKLITHKSVPQIDQLFLNNQAFRSKLLNDGLTFLNLMGREALPLVTRWHGLFSNTHPQVLSLNKLIPLLSLATAIANRPKTPPPPTRAELYFMSKHLKNISEFAAKNVYILELITELHAYLHIAGSDRCDNEMLAQIRALYNTLSQKHHPIVRDWLKVASKVSDPVS
jgi:hypothetical protein